MILESLKWFIFGGVLLSSIGAIVYIIANYIGGKI